MPPGAEAPGAMPDTLHWFVCRSWNTGSGTGGTHSRPGAASQPESLSPAPAPQSLFGLSKGCAQYWHLPSRQRGGGHSTNSLNAKNECRNSSGEAYSSHVSTFEQSSRSLVFACGPHTCIAFKV
jgi:hypothetical protein